MLIVFIVALIYFRQELLLCSILYDIEVFCVTGAIVLELFIVRDWAFNVKL